MYRRVRAQMIEDELAFANLTKILSECREQGVFLERDDYVPRINKLTGLLDLWFECPDHKHKRVSSCRRDMFHRA